MKNIECASIRRQSFTKEYDLNKALIELASDCLNTQPDYKFLANPSGQYIYIYLTQYVVNFCRQYFEKNLDEIIFLDWGCGKGHVTYLLQALGATVISCDIEKNARQDSAFIQETPIISNAKILVEPLTHEFILPYEDNSLDVVLSFGVLEHVKNDIGSVKEINRILKKDGLFFCFNLPQTFSWTQRLAHLRGDYYHNRLYSKSRVEEILGENEFEMLDFWFRQLFPKNNFRIPFLSFYIAERIDLWLTSHSIFKYFATNIEFVAKKA
jgi:SAM-dependent methyltransferase